MIRRFAYIFCTTLGLSVLAVGARADSVTVFAAASLKTALDEVAQALEQDAGMSLTLSYAGSSTIARQVELGAPADLVLTANVEWMDHLEQAGRLAEGTRRDLLGNLLVLVAPSGRVVNSSPDLSDMLAGARLAMGLVSAVPAGIYGKSALEHLGLWNDLAPGVVQTDNVRAALRLVARGDVPFGIVYLSDAWAEPGVEIVYRFPETSHAPIRYPLAIVEGRDGEVTREVLAYLQGERAATIFEAQGFSTLTGAAQ